MKSPFRCFDSSLEVIRLVVDEVYVRSTARCNYLRRALDHEGEVLEILRHQDQR